MRLFYIVLMLSFAFRSYSQEKILPPTVHKYIQERIASGLNPSIAVGIITRDGAEYYSFGHKKRGGKKVTEHTIFEIGSITKVFAATLLADMHLRGEVNINDPISKYLPPNVKAPAFEGKAITLGNLSDHTSSLPRVPDNLQPENYMNPYANYSKDDLYDFLSCYELTRPVGSAYGYSNLAVGLLGNILAGASDQSLEDLIVSRITQPLEMQETRIRLSRKMKKNMATGHQQLIPVPNWDLPALEAAGALRSSVHDLLIFLAANMTFFDHPLNAAMQLTHQTRHELDGRVGLGWHIENSSRGDIYWHNGGTGGFASFAGFNKDLGVGVVVLTNSTETVDKIGFHLLDPGAPLPNILPHVAIPLKEKIERDGFADLQAVFERLKKESSTKYDFSEEGINSLGYYFLNRKQFAEAKAVFLLNITEYPSSGNVYDSYAEALMENGEQEQAITYYKKSLEINPGNTNAVSMLRKLGVHYEMAQPLIDENQLAAYEGTYALTPDFSIVISRQGNQLQAQATGQGSFPIYPKSSHEFYYKVVDAQITFHRNVDGQVVSLTLHQKGRNMEGKKVK